MAARFRQCDARAVGIPGIHRRLDSRPRQRAFRTRRAVRTAAVLSLILLSHVAGCASRFAPLRAGVPRDEPAVIVFFVDGISRDVTREMLAAGELPTIQRLFIEGGVEVEHAIASLPSLTYPNTVSLLTGVWPGRHGVTGNRWFDPPTLIFRDYLLPWAFRDVNRDFDAPTLFEMIADEPTVNVQCPTRRGASRSFDSPVLSGLDWLGGRFERVDRRSAGCVDHAVAYANERSRWPRVTWIYMPGVDEIGHEFGPHSPRYRRALRTVDAGVERVTRRVQAAGLNQVTYVLVTDHGQMTIPDERRFNLEDWLEQWFEIHERASDSADPQRRREAIDHCDALLRIGADRRAAIYVRGGDWDRPATWADLERILYPPGSARSDPPPIARLPAVALVCCRADAERVRVFAGAGQFVVEQRDEGTPASARYRIAPEGVADAAAALGYAALPDGFRIDAWHTAAEWLAATHGAAYPDFVPQVSTLFSTPRAGDIVVFAAPGWALEEDEVGHHGGGHRSDMLAQLCFAGPGLPRGAKLPYARLVDLTPTILAILGRSAPGPLDGENLLPRLREAR